MTEILDSWQKNLSEMETSLSESTGKLLHDSVDFARRHEGAIIAGVLVVGAVALVVKSGAVGDLLEAIGPAANAGGEAAAEAATDASEQLLPRAAPELASIAGGADKAAFLKGVDTYVFDLDRTLVPSGDAYAAGFKELNSQLVQHTGLDSKFVADALSATQERVSSPLFADRLDLVKPIQDLYPGVNLNERFPGIAPAVQDVYHAALKPPQDVVDLLDSLSDQGKTMHVFTASPPATAAEKLDVSGLSKYFDTVFTAPKDAIEDGPGRELLSAPSTRAKIVELMDAPKSTPAGYREILSRLDVAPKTTLMTGDTNVLDTAPAKEAGMYTAQANWMHRDPNILAIPDLTLESPGDLQRLVALYK